MRTARIHRTTTAAALLGLVLSAGACSGDEEPEGSEPKSPGAGVTIEPDAGLEARLGKVTGPLPPGRRKDVANFVGRTVDDWFQAAFLGGDYPRKDFRRAFPHFTAEARRAAARDVELSNERIGKRIEGVVATSREVVVDVFSPRKRPVGATARFRLVFETNGQVEQRVTVRGRLLLTITRKGWRIFGYDVAQSGRNL